MAITFIPNDPKAGKPANRNVTPSKNRPANRVRFVAGAMPPEALYTPGTAQFAAWQCREAAWRTLDVFEGVCGRLPGWRGRTSVKKLQMIHNGGVDLNAYYDRSSISFFQFPVAGKLVYSGASTDVVAHEAGHAILDALRPDLWNVNMIEVAAFHEGFGDCIAILVALSDQATRTALLNGANPLRTPNFVEGTAEDLANAIRIAVSPSHNAAAPRRANNTFAWSLPATLPTSGPPGKLLNESHSFGQLVSGIYWDLIVALFPNNGGEAALWTACQRATKLIVKAASVAPVRPRFLESWGRMMLATDASDNGGANAAAIRAAFGGRGIAIGAAPFLTPQAAVAPVSRGQRGRGVRKLTPAMRGKLRGLFSLDEATQLTTRVLEIAGDTITEVVSDVTVDLTGVSEMLAGVVDHVPRPALLGEVSGTVAVLGSVQSSMLYASEVRDFVGNLANRGAIASDGARSAVTLVRERNRADGGVGKGKAGASFVAQDGVVTHVITEKGGERVLERVAFACGCGRH